MNELHKRLNDILSFDAIQQSFYLKKKIRNGNEIPLKAIFEERSIKTIE